MEAFKEEQSLHESFKMNSLIVISTPALVEPRPHFLPPQRALPVKARPLQKAPPLSICLAASAHWLSPEKGPPRRATLTLKGIMWSITMATESPCVSQSRDRAGSRICPQNCANGSFTLMMVITEAGRHEASAGVLG